MAAKNYPHPVTNKNPRNNLARNPILSRLIVFALCCKSLHSLFYLADYTRL